MCSVSIMEGQRYPTDCHWGLTFILFGGEIHQKNWRSKLLLGTLSKQLIGEPANPNSFLPQVGKWSGTSAYPSQKEDPKPVPQWWGMFLRLLRRVLACQMKGLTTCRKEESPRVLCVDTPNRRGVRAGLQYQAYWTENSQAEAHINWVESFRPAMLPYTPCSACQYLVN